jgi:hypothetical protein
MGPVGSYPRLPSTAAVPIEHQRQGYQVVREACGAVGPPRHFGGNNLEQKLLPLILAEF